MTPAYLITLFSLILVSPFAGLPGLAGMRPGEVWLGWAMVLIVVWLWHNVEFLEDGNCGGENE